MDAVERGKKLAVLRKAANHTQRSVATALGITAAGVSEWERGVSSPEWHRIRPLDDLLGADGQILVLFGMDAPVSRLASVERKLDELIELVLQLANRLPGTDDVAEPMPVESRTAQ